MKRIVMAIAAVLACSVFAANTVLTFSTNGTETYRDGTAPLEGECYALAWTDDAASFAINPDGTATGGKLLLTRSCAEDGRCYPITVRMSEAMAATYSGGTWGVYLLDTRIDGADGGVTLAGTTGNKANVVKDAILVGDATVELANETFMSRTVQSSGKFLLGAGIVADAATLAEQVAAGGEIALCANIALADELVVSKAVTLKLGDFKITAAPGKNAICVAAGGNLTINAGVGGIKADDGKYAVYADYTVSQGAKAIAINGGVFEGAMQFNQYPLYSSGEAAHSGEDSVPTVVTVNGGVFMKRFGLYHAPTTIAGGVFEYGLDTSSASVMVYSNSRCPVVVEGGKFKTEPVSVGSRVRVGEGYYEGGYFVIGDTGVCEAKRNGKFYRHASEAFAAIGTDTKIEILDAGAVAAIAVEIAEGQSLTVPASFSAVSAASGLSLESSVNTADGTVTYSARAAGKVAKIAGNYYATLGDAFAAAHDGDRIVLVEDCEFDVAEISADVELALNGKTVTVAGGSLAITGKLTITGSGTFTGVPAMNDASLANFVVKGGTYPVDPSAFVPSVVAALPNEQDNVDWRNDRYYVFAGENAWTVVPVPKAYVAAMTEKPQVGGYDGTLDVAYTFNAFNPENGDKELADKALASGDIDLGALSSAVEIARALELFNEMGPFLGWHADFAVSLDGGIDACDIALAGQYEKWSDAWVSFESSETLAAGSVRRLLVDYGGANPSDWTYEQICRQVRTFRCGAKMLDASIAGVTMKVQLRLYAPETDVGTGSPSICICEYKYTFGGYAAKIVRDGGAKLYETMSAAIADVKQNENIVLMNDYSGDVAIENCEKPFIVDTNGFSFDVATVTTEDDWAFDRMSNMNWSYYPKKESAVTVEVVSDDGETVALSTVTATTEWLDENVAEGETAEEVLAKVDDNGLAKWQNYVLGQDPTAAVRVDDAQGATVENTPVSNTLASNINVPADSGFTVKYEIDQVSANGEVVSEGTPQNDADAFSLDLTQVEDNAYFRLAAVLEATDGTGAKTKVNSENTIGVLVVKDAPALSIVAVPWQSLSDDGRISVSNLVRTATLTNGDKLYAYEGGYRAWELQNGVWEPIPGYGSAAGSAEADTVKLSRGGAVWLERQDASKPIYFVGEAPADAAASSALAAADERGVDGKQSWNLVASPSVEPVNIADVLAEKGADADRVIVPRGANAAPKNFHWSEKKKAWGYDSTEIVYGNDGKTPVGVRAVFKTDDSSIPAGTGFWYLNSDDAKDVEW